jgi:hypothetical protein
MNGMRQEGEGEGFPLFVCGYGVGIGEAQGLGTVVVGTDLRQVLMKLIIDKKFSENDLKFFEAKVAM